MNVLIVSAVVLQYQALTGPVLPNQPAAPDLSWQPRYDARAPRPTARFTPAQFVGPVNVPANPAAPDASWQPEYPDFVARPTLRLTPSQHVKPVSVPVNPAAPDASWQPDYPDKVTRPTFQASEQLALAWTPQTIASASVPTYFGATPSTPVLRPFSRALYTQSQPLFGVEVDVPVMSWTGWYLDPPVRRRPQVQHQNPAVIFVPDVTVVAPPLSWKATYPDRVWPAARLREYPSTLSFPVYVPDVTQPVTARSWAPNYPDRVFPVRSLPSALQQTFTMDRFDAPGVIPLPDLSWGPNYPSVMQPVRGVRPSWQVGPLYVPDVTAVVTPLSWTPIAPVSVAGLKPRQQPMPAIVAQEPAAPQLLTPVLSQPMRARASTAAFGWTSFGPLVLIDNVITATARVTVAGPGSGVIVTGPGSGVTVTAPSAGVTVRE